MPGPPSADLLAALRPERVTVRVLGTPFTLEATTAAQWLGAMALDLERLHGIMPGLVADDDLETMAEMMMVHPDIEQRWSHAARTGLGRAAGRDWWWAFNLARKALGTWIYTNGLLLHAGLDSKEMNLPDWLDACYVLYWRDAKEDDRIKFDLELSLPPKGIAVHQSRRRIQEMGNAFAAD